MNDIYEVCSGRKLTFKTKSDLDRLFQISKDFHDLSDVYFCQSMVPKSGKLVELQMDCVGDLWKY